MKYLVKLRISEKIRDSERAPLTFVISEKDNILNFLTDFRE